MRKIFLVLLAVVSISMIWVASSEAGVYGAGYPNGDDMFVYSASSWDFYNHLVITYNNQDFSASATVLNPNGVPSNDYGFYYFWADFFSDHLDFYGSNDGSHWVLIGSYY